MKKVLLQFSFIFCTSVLYAQTFYKQLGTPGQNESGSAMINSPDGNIIIGGCKRDSAFVAKMDQFGNVLWMKTFKPEPNYPNHVYQLAITSDNYIIGVGNSFNVASTEGEQLGFYFKFSLSGTMQWIQYESAASVVQFTRIMPKSATEYIVISSVYELSGTYQDMFTTTVDAVTGNIISNTSRIDYIPTSPYIDGMGGCDFGRGGSMYTGGRLYVAVSVGAMRPYVTKFDNNGNYVWSKYFMYNSSTNARIYGNDVLYDNDSLLASYTGDRFGTSTNFTIGLMKMDTMGNVAWSKDYNITSSTVEFHSKIIKYSNGYAILGWTTADFFIIRTDINGNVIWSKSYGSGSVEDVARNFGSNAIVKNNNIYFTGRVNVSGTYDMVIACVDSLGNIACASETNINVTQSNNPTASFNCNPAFYPYTLTAASFGVSPSSTIQTSCGSMTLNLGNDTITCVSSILLNATTTSATQYIWQNGSTAATFSVTTTGTYWVNVYVNCCLITDTIHIDLTPPYSETQNLSICSGDTVTVGNNNYYVSGTYIDTLQTVNGCDSIVTTNLTVNPNPSVSVSGNATVCSGQSVVLTATGAPNYSWSPSSTLSSSTGSPVTATPTSNTTYTVVGYSGVCTDTAYHTVTILPAPALDMGNDAGVCPGDSVQINAQATNGTYSWVPANSLSSSIVPNPIAFPTVTTTYTLYVTGMNGCTNSGTLTVVVYPQPPVPTIQQNGNLLASSSSTGNQWLLNGNPIIGETGQFHTATQNGFYQVMVTDANGCTAISTPYSYVGIFEYFNSIYFSIFPNPSSGAFSIESGEVITGINIYNALGEQIFMSVTQGKQHQIDLSAEAKGIYLIRVLFGDKISTRRIVID